MANRNNLDLDKNDAPHHTELAAAYKMGGTSYGLWPIVAAVAGYTGALDEADDSVPEVAAWNADTMGNRLDKIKAYLKDNNAEAEQVQESPEGDDTTQQPPAGNDDTTDVGGSAGGDEASSSTATSDGETYGELKASNARLSDVIDAVRAELDVDDGEGVKMIYEAVVALKERNDELERKLKDYADTEGVTDKDGVTAESPVGTRLRRVEQMLGIKA